MRRRSVRLNALGFAVSLKLDAGRSELTAAVNAYVAELARRKCVGLFYYAGHGVQLAWRNYMLPVDADIDTIGDIQKQAVEVNSLLAGIGKADNALNVIILDACRDNPFGSLKGLDQKGLSQMDAPASTLLAYATSPGNVASDGTGANGLYTEHLLREIRIPDTHVEDVFKRVRLGVRRASNSAQIPWECTSLEEDFYFLPPKSVREPSEIERDRRFEKELVLWQKVQGATAPEPLVDFLRRYPSGAFAELAQLQIDRVLATLGEKRIRIASQEGNPYSAGSAEADTRWRVGDSYTYARTDLFEGKTMRNTMQTVTEVTASEVQYSDGMVTDLLGNVLRRSGGRVYTPNQLEPLDYAVGKQWVTQYRITTHKGITGRNEMELRIVKREQITVPAGTFNAFRIEGRGVFEEEGGRVEITTLKKWVAPDRLRREVAMEETRERSGRGNSRRPERGGGLRVTQSLRWELVSFKQA